MQHLDQECIRLAKARGFLRNRGTNRFSARVVAPGGVYQSEHLRAIADCAEQCGNGTVVYTARLSAEIVGIPFAKIDEVVAALERAGLTVGGTGSRVRPITACKGTTCVFGCCDTQGLAAELHQRFYRDAGGLVLPHKFKIAVGGCPNRCAKPSLNDFGLEAGRHHGEVLFRVFVGGMWGRKTREGDALPNRLRREEIAPLLQRSLEWYAAAAKKGERFGAAIDRLGLERLEQALR